MLIVLSCAAPAALAQGRFEPGNLGHAISTILIFLLLLAVLSKWAWKPLVAQLQRREEQIADSIKKAEKRETDAKDLMTHYQSRLSNIESEADRLLNESREQAAQAQDRILAEAREEARQFYEKARAEVDEARREALQELYEASAQMATDIAGKILQRKLEADDHDRLVEQSLAEFSRRAKE